MPERRKNIGIIISNHGTVAKSYLAVKLVKKQLKKGHITIFGGSGQGKTTALLIPSLRMWNAPFFSIDTSGDISKNVPQGDLSRYVLSPDEPNESCLYNIFHLVDKVQTAAEKREQLEQLVFLIVDIPPNAQDAQLYFLNTARKIFLAAMNLL